MLERAHNTARQIVLARITSVEQAGSLNIGLSGSLKESAELLNKQLLAIIELEQGRREIFGKYGVGDIDAIGGEIDQGFFGATLKSIRAIERLPMHELARRAKAKGNPVSATMISLLENNHRKPTKKVVEAIIGGFLVFMTTTRVL